MKKAENRQEIHIIPLLVVLLVNRRIRQQRTICTSANEATPAGYPATEVWTNLAGDAMSGERTAGAGSGGGSEGRSPCVDCP